MSSGWQIPLGTLTAVLLVAAFKAKQMSSAADIAAWVQGIGSLLAIAAAIWIYAKQQRDKRADDEAETVAFVQAMRDEVSVVWSEYQGIRKNILAVPEGEMYTAIVPLYTDSLIIYSSSPSRVGKIDDEALRTLIVRMYTGLRGHLNSLRQNNTLVEQYTQLYWDQNLPPMYKEMHRRAMVTYSADLQKADEELTELVESFLADTRAWIDRQRSKGN